jgi:hypothetical protein
MTIPRARLLAVAACAAAAVPLIGASAAAAATCTPGKYPGQGYFTSLKVTGISCGGGRDVMRAHYRCRTKNGIKGKCARVSGYRCSEKRNAIPTEYNARVTCKKGSRKVVYTYSQDT